MDCDPRDVEKLSNDTMVEWAMKLYAKECLQEVLGDPYKYYDSEWCGNDDYGSSYKGDPDMKEWEKLWEM